MATLATNVFEETREVLEWWWWWFAGSTDSGTNSLQKAKCSTNAKNIAYVQNFQQCESMVES